MTELHIRIPDDLAERIKEQAEKNRRSLNTEITIAIEERAMALEMYRSIMVNQAAK